MNTQIIQIVAMYLGLHYIAYE